MITFTHIFAFISCLVPLEKSRNIFSHNVKRAGGYHVKVYLHFNVCLITPVLIKVLFVVSNIHQEPYTSCILPLHSPHGRVVYPRKKVLQSDTIGTRKSSHLGRLKMERFCVLGTMTKCPRGGGVETTFPIFLPLN